MQTRVAFDRLFAVPENASALAAVRTLADTLGEPEVTANPLFLHGPSGTGKTTLAAALADAVSDRATVGLHAALDFPPPEDDEPDLLILEDVQHLPARAAGAFARLLDERTRRRQQTVVTALVGPARLTHRGQRFSARLTSRLAGGLVVALEPWSAESRRRFLHAEAERRNLRLTPDVLDWLAEQLTAGRALAGALGQLEALQALHRRPIDIELLREHFPVEGRPTVERILEHVGGYFRVPPRQLTSARRLRGLVLPRQVGMYLARRLTGLSLQQIGACFGGRDHTTVRHACKKVEAALQTDPALSGVVRRMHAELT